MGKRKRNVDMLSGLPDEVLHHILSLLPTKLSVSTSVLAKRWRFLWTHVPNLQFHGDHLDNINRVIMLHQAKTVNTFSLSSVKSSEYQLETVIIYPIKRGVQNLYLDFVDEDDDEDEDEDDGESMWTLPRFLHTCKTLVDLKLANCGVIPCSGSGEWFLPNLKKLNLSSVAYEDDESLPCLLTGCPVLEELIVNNYVTEEKKNSGCVIVSSPTIQTLTVDFSKGRKDTPDEMLIIDVPALIYLKVTQCRLDRVKSLRKTMTSLIEAEITLAGCCHECGIDCTEHGHSNEFLSCLCHVRYLKISSDSGGMLVDIVGTGSVAKFVNLTKLELELAVNWYNLVKFLEVADNLEVLIFNLCGTASYKEPKRVPPCMLSRLRAVRIKFFRARQDAFDIMRYILRNAQVLERMEISPTYSYSDKEMLDTLQTILLFERMSKSCQVAFDRGKRNAKSFRYEQNSKSKSHAN